MMESISNGSQVTFSAGNYGGCTTSESWDYQELLMWFFNACLGSNPAAGFAAGLLLKAKKLHIEIPKSLRVFEVGFLTVA